MDSRTKNEIIAPFFISSLVLLFLLMGQLKLNLFMYPKTLIQSILIRNFPLDAP